MVLHNMPREATKANQTCQAISILCRGEVQARSIVHPPLAPVRTAAELAQLEATTRVYDLFCWLAWRFADAFQVQLPAPRAAPASQG